MYSLTPWAGVHRAASCWVEVGNS